MNISSMIFRETSKGLFQCPRFLPSSFLFKGALPLSSHTELEVIEESNGTAAEKIESECRTSASTDNPYGRNTCNETEFRGDVKGHSGHNGYSPHKSLAGRT